MADELRELGLGRGIYTVPEAARLTGIPPSKVRRLVYGYGYVYRGERHAQQPVFEADYSMRKGTTLLSFADLVELRFLDAFRRLGVSLHQIRHASRVAATWWRTNHPFSSARFRTDGRKIFAEILRADVSVDDPDYAVLVEVVKRQHVFRKVIDPVLQGLLFRDGAVTRWHPDAGLGRVVIDPHLNLGTPSVGAGGVPTSILAAAVEGGASAATAAEWYDVTPDDVLAAMGFEQSLAA